MSKKGNKQRGPLTPRKKPKTLFIVDGTTTTLPRHVADNMGFLIDMAGANQAASINRVEEDWGYYISRFGMGLVHCMVHEAYASTDDFKNDELFRMRFDTTAQMYLNIEGMAEEAVEMAAKLRSRLKASWN